MWQNTYNKNNESACNHWQLSTITRSRAETNILAAQWMFWFLNELAIYRTFFPSAPIIRAKHTLQQNKGHGMCFFCGAKKMLALQRTRLHAVLNRLERSGDSLAMIREKRSSVFSLVQGLGAFKSPLSRLYATHHSFRACNCYVTAWPNCMETRSNRQICF